MRIRKPGLLDTLLIGDPPIEIPGVIQELSVDGKLLVDLTPVEATSGQKCQVSGWDDGDINITTQITDDPNSPALDELKKLDRIFKKVENGQPVVYPVSHPHLEAGNISKVLFTNLTSTQGKGYIMVNLKFREYNPPVALVQSQSTQATTTPTAAPATSPPLSAQQQAQLDNMTRNIS